MHGNSDSRALRWVLGVIGVLVSLGLLVASGFMNYRFGYSLGKTPTDGQIYGCAAILSDIFKAIAPFFFFAALRSRVWNVAIAAAAVWAVTTGFALTGAFGHAALNRLTTAAERTLASTNYKDHRADLKRYQDELSWLPPHRAGPAVRAEMEALKAQRLWTVTSECQEPAGKMAREFCSGYHKLDAELGNALQADKLNTKIEETGAKLGGAKADAVMTESDPQAGILARVSGWQLDSVQLGLAILIVLLLEFGSGLGPYVSLHYIAARPRKAELIPAAPEPAEPPRAPALAIRQAEPPRLLAGPQEAVVLQSGDAGQLEPLKALPPPRRPRKLVEGGVQHLMGIGFPIIKPKGGLQAKEKPKEAARRFSIWARCYEGTQGDYSNEEIGALYREFAIEDHREPVPEDQFRGALANVSGIAMTRPVRPDGKRPTVWTVGGTLKPKTPRLAAPAEQPEQRADSEPEPVQEGRRVVPFGAARAVPMRPDPGEPAWLHENAKAMRRMRLALNQKQRGSRIARRVA